MYGVAIIGCGDMGTKHAAAWHGRGDARVVAVCDPLPERAEALALQFEAHQYEIWQDAVADPAVDVVSVCVPACDHRDVAVTAAKFGRHVLCEKAMALTLDQADEMIAAAHANDVCLSVCHQYRSFSRFKTMKHIIDEGRLGEQIFMRFAEMREVRPKLAMHSLGMNGGPVHDMSGHLFDLGRYLTGSEPESVNAVGAIFGAGKERLKTVTDFGIDTAEIQVRFHGGHCLSIGINWGLPEGTPGHCHELIHGKLGMMCAADQAQPERFLGDLSDTVGVLLKDANGTTLIECLPDNDGPHACIDDLLNAIETGQPSQFDGIESRAALRLVLASLEAIETCETVWLK